MYHYYINKICYGLHTVIKINTESFQYLADIGLYTCMVKRSKSKNPSTCILKHIFLVKICDFFFSFSCFKTNSSTDSKYRMNEHTRIYI